MMGGSTRCFVAISVSGFEHEDMSFVGRLGSGPVRLQLATRSNSSIVDEISRQGPGYIDTFAANSPFTINVFETWAGELKRLVAPTQSERRIALRRQPSLCGTFKAKTKDCSEHHLGLVERS